MLSRRAFLFGLVTPVLQSQKTQRSMFADAEAYDRFMGRWSRLVAPRLVDFARLPEQGRLLDVGSGTGALAFAMAQRHHEARILGIDPSKQYVAYAVERNPYPDRARFEVGDAQRLHFDSASFDGAASLLVFNFIPDPIEALLELRRVTKPGGGISAAVWDYGAGMRMLRIFWDAAVSVDRDAEKLDERHMPLCRAGELSALWKQGGLDHIQEQAMDIEMRFDSFADYWEPFLLGQGPAGSYARRLGRAKLDDLRREVIRLLGPSREKAPFALPARLWAVRGIVSSHP